MLHDFLALTYRHSNALREWLGLKNSGEVFSPLLLHFGCESSCTPARYDTAHGRHFDNFYVR